MPQKIKIGIHFVLFLALEMVLFSENTPILSRKII